MISYKSFKSNELHNHAVIAVAGERVWVDIISQRYSNTGLL